MLSQTIIEIDGEECRCSRGVAKILNIGPRIMLAHLRSKGIFNKKNIPTSMEYLELGYFKVKTGKKWDVKTTYYTSAGIDFVKEVCADVPKKKEPSFKYADNFSQETSDALDAIITG